MISLLPLASDTAIYGADGFELAVGALERIVVFAEERFDIAGVAHVRRLVRTELKVWNATWIGVIGLLPFIVDTLITPFEDLDRPVRTFVFELMHANCLWIVGAVLQEAGWSRTPVSG